MSTPLVVEPRQDRRERLPPAHRIGAVPVSDDIDYHTTANADDQRPLLDLLNEAWQRAHFAGETDVVELISAAMRNVERGNRWAAFTDDEIESLLAAMQYAYLVEPATLEMIRQVEAEIERRKTGAT